MRLHVGRLSNVRRSALDALLALIPLRSVRTHGLRNAGVRLVAVALVVVACSDSTPPPQPTAGPPQQTTAPSLSPSSAPTLSSTPGSTAEAIAPRPPEQHLIVSTAYLPGGQSGEQVVTGQPTLVSAHALGESGVAALELWDGTELAAVQEADPGSPTPAFYAQWQWTPEAAGTHTLFVRAIDLRGSVVQSNVVQVEVADRLLSTRSAQRGDAIALVGSGFPLDASHSPPASYAMSVPAVQATLNDCQLELSISNGAQQATGLQLVGLAPGSSNFAPLMTYPGAPAQSQTINLVGAGKFLFAAAAFDSNVQAFGPPVEVTPPGECASTGWSGDVSLIGGVLKTPQSVDEAYLYLTESGGAAVRVPAVQGQFVSPGVDGELNFSPFLPSLEGASFAIEAWGWSNGVLVSLGQGSFAAPPAPPPGGATIGGPITFAPGGPGLTGGMFTALHVLNTTVVTGSSDPDACSKEHCYYDEPSLTSVVERPPAGSSKPIWKKFSWSTSLTNVSQLVWQILPYPPAGSADLSPPFLIDQGVIALSPNQSDGEFSLDFNKYFQASVVTANPQQPPAEKLILGPLFGTPGPTTSPTATSNQGDSGTQGVFAQISLKLATFSDRFYVRLVPIQFNSALLPSNPVSLDIIEPANQVVINDPNAGEGTNDSAYTIQWSYTPPIGANPKYARCALVKAVGPNVPSPWSVTYKQAMSSGTPICYKPPSKSGWSPFDVFDAFVEFVSDVWDFVADGYAWIKQKVVSLALAAVPCSQIASKSVCETIANTALDAALASFGIPPSLPNFDAVVAGLKGDLATLIVESASSLPGVAEACGLAEAGNAVTSKIETCEALAGVAVDAIVEQIEAARSNAAANAAGIPAWPGLVLVPDPRGQLQSPSFTVTVTRTSDPVLPKTCSLSVYMKSTKKNWTFPELHQGYPKNVTADVSGNPFLSTGFVIDPLPPGQSLTRQLWLTQTAIWFESWRAELYWHYYQALLNTDYSEAWALLTAGAQLTFGVQSNCAKGSEQGPYVLPASAYQ